jgi:hypothetical protein
VQSWFQEDVIFQRLCDCVSGSVVMPDAALGEQCEYGQCYVELLQM